MTDRPPEFVADDGSFDDVMHRVAGRRRRRHVLVGVGTAVVVAAVAVPVVASTSSGTDTLVVPPAGAPTSPPASSESAPSVSRTTGGGATAVPSAAPTASGDVAGQPPMVTPSPPPASATAVARPRTTPPTTVVAGPLVSTSMKRSRAPYDANSVCGDTSGRSATGWCVTVDDANDLHGTSGEPVPLTIELCRLPGVAGDAHFAGTLEADLRLRQDGPHPVDRWHYANQHPDRAFSHRYRVDGGSCLVWRTTWQVTDDDGGRLDSGSYTLFASVNADNVVTPNGALVETYRFTVD